MSFWLYLLLILIHLLICLVLYVLFRLRLFKTTRMVFAMAVFVPIFGVISLLLAEYLERRHRYAVKSVGGLHSFLLGDDYRTSQHRLEQDDVAIPLEEAIELNDTQTRRALMLDIIRQAPEKHVNLLQRARLNSDMEVSHYASTAMMDVQRKYTLLTRKLEDMLAAADATKKEPLLNELLAANEEYLKTGILQDNMMLIVRQRYGELLEEKMKLTSDDHDTELKFISNLIEIKQYDRAESYMDSLGEAWKDDEEFWFYMLKLLFEGGKSERFSQALNELSTRKMYLSPEMRSRIAFWHDAEKEGAANEE